MTQEIELSIMAPSAATIQPLLDQFEQETGIRVHVRLLSWDSAWGMFVRAALYNDGPDVSEVGTTWLGDLIGMSALRPFDASDLATVGRAGSFFPAAWKTVVRPAGAGEERAWAVPWLAGARILFYRPALLRQAGVDPAGAFVSLSSISSAVSALRDGGIHAPWTVPTGYTHTTLLNIASWVWAAGGDFLTPDGRKTAFLEPAALEGMAAYFDLGRCMPPEARPLNGLEPDEYFLSNPGAAMTISGAWLFLDARRRFAGDDEQFGAALPPGASFVGGSNLVIWKHSRHPEAAMKLIRFLTRKSSQASHSQNLGLLPARAEVLDSEPFCCDPFWSTAVRGLKQGRTFPTVRLWGLVEDRLTAGFSAVWNDVLAGVESKGALARHLAPLKERLDALLVKE